MGEASVPSGALFVVATPIGNLTDISQRALDVLKKVDFIVCEDTRVTRRLLTYFGIKNKPLYCFHQHSSVHKLSKIVERLERGERGALVTDAGTPGISDPGRPLVRECIRRNIAVHPVPGPSAVMAALMASGAECGRGFVFAGYLPSTRRKKRKTLEALAREKRPVVVFESPHRLLETLDMLVDIMPDREICVCREMTKMYEEFIRGCPENVKTRLQGTVRGECTLVFMEKRGA